MKLEIKLPTGKKNPQNTQIFNQVQGTDLYVHV